MLFTTIVLFSLVACMEQKHTDIQKMKEISIEKAPKGFGCFNSPRVFIKYKQPVNGYTVKAMWLPYYNSGDTTIAETGVLHLYFLTVKIINFILTWKLNTLLTLSVSIIRI